MKINLDIQIYPNYNLNKYLLFYLRPATIQILLNGQRGFMQLSQKSLDLSFTFNLPSLIIIVEWLTTKFHAVGLL